MTRAALSFALYAVVEESPFKIKFPFNETLAYLCTFQETNECISFLILYF